MPLVTDFLNELKHRGLQPTVIADRRALIPGGMVQVDLLPPTRVTTASLIIKSVHPIGQRFEDANCYVITEIVVDDCDVISPSAALSASHLYDLLSRCPSLNSSTGLSQPQHDEQDRQQHSRRSRWRRRRFNNSNHFAVTHRCKFARYRPTVY